MKPAQELQEDEELIKSAHPSHWSYLPAYLLGLFTLFLSLEPLTIIAGLIFLTVTDLHRRGNRYFVTSDRIIREFKFLKKDSQEATTDLVSDVSIDQSLNQRLIRIGDINIKTASGEDIEFSGVKHPGEMKSEISTVKNREKNEPQEVKVVEENGNTYCPNCGEKIEEGAESIPIDKLLDQTISEIKDDVKSRDIDIEELIQAEEDGKDRKTLIDWLEKPQ